MSRVSNSGHPFRETLYQLIQFGTITMKRSLCGLCLLLATQCVALIDAIGEGFEGEWRVLSDDPHSTPTSRGLVRIRNTDHGYYVDAEHKDMRLSGIGILDGENLYVGLGSWTRGPKAVGVAIYSLLSGGIIDGRWLTVDEQSGTEKGVSSGQQGLVGSFQIQGQRSGGGSGYSGELAISSRPSGYWLDWTIGGNKYRGIGRESNGQVIGSWCISGLCALAHYKLVGDTLESSVLRSDLPTMVNERLKMSIPANPSGQGDLTAQQ